MARSDIDHIDDLRRRGEITWDDYKQLLKSRPQDDWNMLLKEFAQGIRDKDGRLRRLQDLGGDPRRRI